MKKLNATNMKYLILFIVLIFSSCISFNKCAKKFPPEKITETREIIKEVYRDSIIPSASVIDTFLLQEFVEIPVNRWISIVDTTGKSELRIMKNEFNQLVINCTAKETIITTQEKTIQTLKEENETQILHKTPPWAWWSLAINMAVIAFLGIKIYLKIQVLKF